MNRIYEVTYVANAMKTIYVSAENAEEAVNLAETLYKNSDEINLKNELSIDVEATSVTYDDYYEKSINENNDDLPCSVHAMKEECESCMLYNIFNSIFDPDTDKE